MATRLFRFPSTALAALFALILVLFTPAQADQSDKGVIADLISRALSSPSMTVSIGAVDGVLSSDVTIHDIVLSDRDGAWLKVDKVRLIWNRLALFSRRLEVDQLTIGHIDFLRRPLPSETPPPDANAPGAADPARTAAQGDRQTARGRSAFARRAGHRAGGAAQYLRPGDAGAALRRNSTSASTRGGSMRPANSARC